MASKVPLQKGSVRGRDKTSTRPGDVSSAPAARAHPFDAVAEQYDAAFTGRLLGRWLRRMVWQRLARAFEPGQHILELGCGTGEDAVWLAQRGMKVTATDASGAMLEVARRKASEAGVTDRVVAALLDLRSPEPDGAYDAGRGEPLAGQYDGAFSNFGPLNCVEDRRRLVDMLARQVRPGGRVVLVVMGPFCPWEIVWHIGHGQFRTAFRRFRSGTPARVGDGGTMKVWYPAHRRLQREFAPQFRTVEVAGLGLLLPHSEMSGVVERAPRAFRLLARLDRRFARTLPWRWLTDHYVLVVERR